MLGAAKAIARWLGGCLREPPARASGDEYYAVAFPDGLDQHKIIEALTLGASCPAILYRFRSPVLRDQFVSGQPTLRYSVSRKQAEKLRLL